MVVRKSSRKQVVQLFIRKFNDVFLAIPRQKRTIIMPFLPGSLSENLSMYITNVVAYIAGYVVRRIKTLISCVECINALMPAKDVSYLLIARKDRGGLVTPSEDVCKICRLAESHVRYEVQKCVVPNMGKIISNCFMDLIEENLFKNLDGHVLEQEPMNNHRYFLIKLILKTYLNICFSSIGKMKTSHLKSQNIRSVNKKMDFFEGH